VDVMNIALSVRCSFFRGSSRMSLIYLNLSSCGGLSTLLAKAINDLAYACEVEIAPCTYMSTPAEAKSVCDFCLISVGFECLKTFDLLY
jgi:hypothetical protein